MQSMHNAPSIYALTHSEQKTLLLKLGDSDESLYYQAVLGRSHSGGAVTVHVHAASLVAERLKLYGTLKITAQLPDGSTYLADLTLPSASADEDNLYAAALTLVDRCADKISTPRFLPHT